MTTQIADFYALTNRLVSGKFHSADSDRIIPLGWPSGIGLGRIEEFRTLARREHPNGF